MGQESRIKVADAWANDQPAQGANVFTDGERVYSYGHQVGEADDDGNKVAFDCHYSVTTAKHCSAFKGVADRVVDCIHQ